MLCMSYHNFFQVSKERKVHGYWSLGKASSHSQSRYHRRKAVQSSKWYQPQLTAHHPLPGSGYHASSRRVYALWSLPSHPPSSLLSHSSPPGEMEQRGGHWKLYSGYALDASRLCTPLPEVCAAVVSESFLPPSPEKCF